MNKLSNEKAFVLWFTGLSGSGKTTLADLVYESLVKEKIKVEKLDGDIVREIFPKTGFSRNERIEHVKKSGFIASMLERNGIVVVASFISPYKESRDFVRSKCLNFIEVYVRASLEECERRDVKGLYRKARAGEIKNFTGIDDPYEEPGAPEIVIDTEKETVEESVGKIMGYLGKYID